MCSLLIRMEIDLEVGLRLRALAAMERGGAKAVKKETRRARVLAERLQEVRAAAADLQSRALDHLSRRREADEDEDEDGDDDAETELAQSEAVHEFIGLAIPPNNLP